MTTPRFKTPVQQSRELEQLVAATIPFNKAILVGLLAALTLPLWVVAAPAVGAAPKGGTVAVATRIIKYNFPSCRKVTRATRGGYGSIRATCNNTEYLVFTVFNAKEGKTVEVALNCAASKQLLNVEC